MIMKNTILIITPQDKKILNQVLDYASRIYGHLANKVLMLEKRIDEFEKCNRIAEVKEHIKERLEEKTNKRVFRNMRPVTKEDAKKLVNKIGLCAKEVKQMNKTADEMFMDLGYEKISSCEYKRIELDDYDREVFIVVAEEDYEAIKYIKDKELNAGIAEWISSKELKAIHKKIEELKGE